MSLLVKAQREGQTIARVTPESACWRYVGFAAYRLGTMAHLGQPSPAGSDRRGHHRHWLRDGLRDAAGLASRRPTELPLIGHR